MSLYSYTYDVKTGGILLNSSPTGFSKEPRPVYADELDLFGFDKFWQYEKQSEIPYMWAESNNYWYRGKLVAKLKGGDIYNAPEIIIPQDKDGNTINPELNGCPLRSIDINSMIEANSDMLEIIEQTTVKKILAIYEKYKNKIDLFYVAYSGGKDSAVLLDLVKKALPKGSFIVVFGDTEMEFPDTYDLIDNTKKECDDENIPFYTAKSHLTPEQSWRLLGPPSRSLRWCCSVHKSIPQTMKLREITGKIDYTGLTFVGVRASESSARAKYKFENYGKKQKGQYSHNSILEWTSAEIWLYIFSNDILINNAYKKGNSRAGCICCPMTVKKADYIKHQLYSNEMDKFVNIITEKNGRNFGDESYITKGGWVSRRSGRDLKDNSVKYHEKNLNGELVISVIEPKTDWKEWMKTLNKFGDIPFTIKNNNTGYTVKLNNEYIKANPTIGKLFKQVFRKSAFCVQCGACVTNCSSGHLKFERGIKITNCDGCLKCHEISDGCLAYNSLKIPEEGKNMSINCFDSVLPKDDWFERFFEKKNEFWDAHGLGPNQVKTFKRFLKDSELTNKNNFTHLASVLKEVGWNAETSWGIILINLVANNPQIRWYVSNFEVDIRYKKDIVLSMLLEINSSKYAVNFVYTAYKKLMLLPLGTKLKFGYVTKDGDLVRTKCFISDSRVVLYSLFKFAEQCNDFKQFTLSTLINDNIDRNGISPSRIFGINSDEMKPYLLGLSAKFPNFINASFTHDLEKITLATDKSSIDVLKLFNQEGYI